MEFTIQELNELVYCLGRIITEDSSDWNKELRKELFEKIYDELEFKLSLEENTIN